MLAKFRVPFCKVVKKRKKYGEKWRVYMSCLTGLMRMKFIKRGKDYILRFIKVYTWYWKEIRGQFCTFALVESCHGVFLSVH